MAKKTAVEGRAGSPLPAAAPPTQDGASGATRPMSEENSTPDIHSQTPLQPKKLSKEELESIGKELANSLTTRQQKAISRAVSKSIATNLAKSLTAKDYYQIGKSLSRSIWFWVVLVVAVLIVCFAAWRAVPHFIKVKAETQFHTELTNQIRLQFQEPRISNIVVAVVSSEASNLMQQTILPEVADFKKQVSAQIEQVSTVANNAVSSLYSSMTNEHFSLLDTNNLALEYATNGLTRIIVRLSHVPIPGSVEGYLRAANSVEDRLDVHFVENITATDVWNYDTNTMRLTFRYVIDQQRTNFYYSNRMPKLGQDVFFLPGRQWRLLNVTK